ncbi:MAG: NlpC/P60 family protein [bacterium]|nr:NlpC/P60 family protein [bacterium]
MKKTYLILILLILSALGSFVYTYSAQAADPVGTCTITYAMVTPVEKKTENNVTQAACNAKASPTEEISVDWQPKTVVPNTSYKLLSPLPGLEGTYEIIPDNPIGRYMNTLITIFIGICAVLAMIMIVVGGLEYMTSELVSSKESGKSKITQAIFGLLLALGAWTILNTINPDLLNADLKNMEAVAVTVELGGEGGAPFVSRTPQALQAIGITCSGGSSNLVNIAQSFVDKSVYSRDHRNDIREGKAYVDCSSYVSQVYACAGLGNPGGTTASIFGSAGTPVTSISADGTKVNEVELRVGDLLGWKAGDGGIEVGHVVMYIGDGKIIDASASLKGVTVRSLSSYKYLKSIKYINRRNAGSSGSW